MTDNLLALDRRHVWHPFTQAAAAPPPILVERAQGARLFAADGSEYLDLVSSWWVNPHGHAHPAIARAVAAQAERLEQVIFADFTHEPAIRVAARICDMLPEGLSRVFFSDNGSTAVEVALKMALQYWRNRGEARRTRFIAFESAYHGDTVGAMSAGSGSGFFRAFAPLLFPVDTVPFPETWLGDDAAPAREAAALTALERALEADPGSVAAVIIEPLIQGAGGMRMCRPEFLRALAAMTAERGALLIFDEVMTGFGRTGGAFACIEAGVTPDLICLSKGLTGGFLPLALTVCREGIHAAFLGEGFDRAFSHGHSFTANPLGCAAALASLDLLEQPRTQARIAAIGAAHRRGLEGLAGHPRISRRRLTGTVAALDVEAGEAGYGAPVGQRLKRHFLERGILVRPLGHVWYLLPPYCVTDDELDRAYAVLAEALETV